MQDESKPRGHQVPPSDRKSDEPEPAATEAGPEETPGETARKLIRATDKGALATLLAKDRQLGWPYASLVLVACDQDASPLFLFSDLAEHAQNLQLDERGSIMLDATSGLDNPLTGSRVTLLGRIAKSDDPSHRRRFINRHPSAAGYAQFGDFNVYRMAVESAHLVAGFGRIHWLTPAQLLIQPEPAIADNEDDILAHMNQDHADAIRRMASSHGLPDGDWTMTGIDAEGCDIRAGGAIGRIPFERTITNLDEVRAEMIRLAKA